MEDSRVMMEALRAKKPHIKGQVTRLCNNIQALSETSVQATRLKLYSEQASTLVNKVTALFEELLTYAESAEYDEIGQEFHHELNRLDELIITIGNMLTSNTEQTATNSNPGNSPANCVRLPRIETPTFSDNLIEWLAFHDLFQATVHNNSNLSPAQKLQYLKSSLKGDAGVLLHAIPITDSNYIKAWDLLVNRYSNERELVYSYLERLMNQTPLKAESAKGLRRLLDTSLDCLETLRVLKEPVDSWNTFIVFLLRQKLDPESLRQWELSHTKTSQLTFKDFSEFLENRSRALEAMDSCRPALHFPRTPDRIHGSSVKSRVTSHIVDSTQCPVCGQHHNIYRCEEFRKWGVDQRRKFVYNSKLCTNCLRRDHFSRSCTSGGCKVRGQRHNSLLHFKVGPPVQSSGNSSPDQTIEESQQALSTHFAEAARQQRSQVLLPTAMIGIVDSHNEVQLCRALLDSGSQATFIRSDCVQRLGLKITRTCLEVSGLSSKVVSRSRGSSQLRVTPCSSSKVAMHVNAHILPKITSSLPQFQVDVDSLSSFKDLKLADPKCHKPGRIDVLLGIDVWPDLMFNEQRRSSDGMLVAHQSIFGWVLFGRAMPLEPGDRISKQSVQVNCAIDDIVRKFWEVEDLPTVEKHLTVAEETCEKHFQETTTRDKNGRYIVRLPFKSSSKPLGSSRDIALNRLLQIERRLKHDGQAMKSYCDFMAEYIALGHMEEIPSSQIQISVEESYYIPHHAVAKQWRSANKFRVVFDASAKSSSGVSLNDKLLVGPTVQDSILSILLRFRQHQVAMTADIKKMYRQVMVHRDDQKFQRIVWRPVPEEPVRDYRLTTVTYGTASAPYLATRCLVQMAEDEKESFPQAAKILVRDFYVDDLLSGAETVEDATKLQSDLTLMLERGGFEICKWSSNSTRLLESIPLDKRQTELPLSLATDSSVKALGLQWHPATDTFSFEVASLPDYQLITKRQLLSDISKIFDPLGLVSPVIITGKILMQNLWKLDIDWDDPLPPDILEEWRAYRQALPSLGRLRIKRCAITENPVTYQLHGFCDASERAFASAVYLHTKDSIGHVETWLLIAKTKVAPLKSISIPRLELCGAVLLTQTLEMVIKTFAFNFDIICWTDSTIVLAWLKSEPYRWKTFVENRVSKIQTMLPTASWRRVCSEENPADCASRGISPGQLLKHRLWWTGPSQMVLENQHMHEVVISPQDILIEEKLILKSHAAQIHVSSEQESGLLFKYSSLFKLKRITAYCRRFLYNCKVKKLERRTDSLSSTELREAMSLWIKTVQAEMFSEELLALKKGKSLKVNSRIVSLNPFLDSEGILRVGGRLRHAKIPARQKHPILLPRDHRLTYLLLTQVHLSHLHAGPQLMLAVLHTEFWILSARDAVRRHVRRCVICCRYQARVGQQLMGDLPVSRVSPTRPFQVCGIDYCGPFLLRASKGRGRTTFKGYIALFICFSTRAVHIELVSDLSSEAFIAALRRFISRRGRCTDIYSDCGTNFVGASKKLGEISRLYSLAANNGQVSTYLSEQEITWHFNPPGAPHMGGLWEAGIKSVKSHLKRVIGEVVLTFEEMYTLLTQIEACLNSRPLTPISSDPNDLEALTPGHFLVGRPLTAMSEPDIRTEASNTLGRWQLLQKMQQHFWYRWQAEYLARMQQRPKWLRKKENLSKNDLVIIKDERLPPLKWKLGRVMELFPGADGVVRVVLLRTEGELLKRAISKLIVLSQKSESNN